MKAERPDLKQLREKALQRPDVKEAYDALSHVYEMKRTMIAMRKKAGLTQEQMAKLLGTKKSNISRLESIGSEISPRLSTLEQYASVLGYSVKVEFEAVQS